MISKLILVLLLVVGLINFLPVIGALSASKLSQAYGLEFTGSDIIILMRHRALLFGIVGGFVIYSLFVPHYQNAAMLMAAVSMVGFLLLMWQEGGYNASLYKVMVIDIAGIASLVVATVLKFFVVDA